MDFIIAIAFTTGIIMLVVGMFGFQLVVSAKRLRKAQRLAAAAIESTPAFMTIVFDEHDCVIDLKIQNPTAEAHFRPAFINKKKQELSFMPQEWQNPGTDSRPAQKNGKATAPLTMPDGNTLYLKWEMQDFSNDGGKTDLRIARGYDTTAELLQTQRKLKRLSAASSEKDEQERKRIAEDLHDRIGEVLVTSRRLLETLKKKSPSPEFSRGLEELDEAIKKFKRGTRSVISELVPPALYNAGFAAAVDSLVVDFQRQHQIAIRLEDAWQDFSLNQEIAIFLYKAVREFIMNAMRHGGADEILISLTRTDETLAVTVQDNGSGFESETNPLTPGADAGFGLFNVKNRSEYYGGDIAIG
jgi:signal transduction histidine kinase